MISPAVWEALFNGTLDAVAIVDLQGHILRVNRAFESTYGWSAEEAVGMRLPMVPDHMTEEAERVLNGAVRGEPVSALETVRRRRDGTLIEVSVTISAVRDAAGKTVAVASISRDITERKRSEEALKESEARYRDLFESAYDVVFLIDRTGNFIDVNRRGEELTGYSRVELLSMNVLRDLIIPEDRSVIREVLRDLIRGKERVYEVRWQGKDGTIIQFEGATTSRRSASGELLWTRCTLRDITERRRLEEELRRQREALSQTEKLAAMGSLLAGVAHELNNPLMIVLGQAGLLRDKLANAPLAERAGKIVQAAERCARIVKNFLALARQWPPERREVQLNAVVLEAMELLAYPLRADTVEVRLDLAPDIPPLWADPHQLHQVVVNLVTNAHQALRGVPPPRRLTLTTRFEVAEQRVSLEVADTGPGIPSGIQGRIFEPFFTTKPPGQGTGLGLSLCHGIIEKHGGAIRVESQPGQGAAFRIDLPVAMPPRAARETPIPIAEPFTRSLAILVVDDEPEVAGLLAEMLSADGHQVETALDGTMALDKLRERAYDVILSDIRMPYLDGPGLYRELERRYPQLLPRIIFLTGDALSPEIRRFLEETGAPNFSKPFSLAEIHQLLRRTPS